MATDAEMVAKYREKAKDKTLPQDARNMYLDKAVELEQKAYKQAKPTSLGPKMAKGGMVKKKMSAYNAVYMGKDKRK